MWGMIEMDVSQLQLMSGIWDMLEVHNYFLWLELCKRSTAIFHDLRYIKDAPLLSRIWNMPGLHSAKPGTTT